MRVFRYIEVVIVINKIMMKGSEEGRTASAMTPIASNRVAFPRDAVIGHEILALFRREQICGLPGCVRSRNRSPRELTFARASWRNEMLVD